MLLSEEFVADLKSKTDIEDVISEYVSLQRKGKNLMGVCPFHSERTASFCVYPSNGSFYCFGCGAGGDIITFLRMAEHYDYVEAVKKLAERAGMDLEISEEDNAVHKKKLQIYELNRKSAMFYYKQLFSSKGAVALNYLSKRGISPPSVKHFGLGYSPSSGFALVDYLQKLGYNPEDMVTANLAFKSYRSGKISDRFKGRLMFPIIDVRGNVIAFGARTMSNEVPKYINTSDTPVFKKSTNLFALNFAKSSIQKKLILAEGYMDVVALHQAGFTNAVAGLGTALTAQQVKLISRYADEITLSYDSDEPGQKAAARAITMLKDNGINVKVLSIPKAKDPDEYLRSQGKDSAIKFKNLLESSKNDVEYSLDKLKSNCNLEVTDDKINYLTQASKIIAMCQNPVEREIYAFKISEETGVNKSSVILQIKKYLKQKFRRNQKKEFRQIQKDTSAINDKINPEKHANLRAAIAEERLISTLINCPESANTIFRTISPDMFVTQFNRRVLSAIQEILSKNGTPDITNISLRGFSLEETGAITRMVCSWEPYMGLDESVKECIDAVLSQGKKNMLKDINNVTETEIQKYIKELKNNKST